MMQQGGSRTQVSEARPGAPDFCEVEPGLLLVAGYGFGDGVG